MIPRDLGQYGVHGPNLFQGWGSRQMTDGPEWAAKLVMF
jgi:hypothetical protein